VPLSRKSHSRPDGRMGVLAAVLPHSRDVASNISRIPGRFIERGRQQANEAQLRIDQVLQHGLHSLRGPFGLSRAAQDGPALWQKIDLAFGAFGGTQGLAIVKVSAPVPSAVPG